MRFSWLGAWISGRVFINVLQAFSPGGLEILVELMPFKNTIVRVQQLHKEWF